MKSSRTGSGACSVILSVFSALLLGPIGASAGVIYMKNGDRLTGTISKIFDNEVYFEPDYGDEFAIDIEAIDYMESDRDFDLEISIKEDTTIFG